MNKSPVLLLLVAVLLFIGCVDQNTPIVTTTLPASTTTISTSTTTSTSSTTTTQQTTTTTHPSTTSLSTTSSSTKTTTSTTLPKISAEPKVEVVFFYPNYACASCDRVGAMIEKTVYADYSQALSSGKLVYKRENLGNPADKADIVKYGALAPSLWIGTTVNGTEYKETKLGVWYKAQDEESFTEYFDGIINRRLKGDLTD